MLHYYNNYFGIPYPLKKLDLIGLPDFEAGAMENFGAITYRENVLLLDPKTAAVGTRKTGVAGVIAHEMAHQWFGDLVTMQWWDNIWLNEGFATWMANKPLEAMHPEWNIDQSVISDLDGILNIDAQPTTRTIRATADTPDEINQMFDGITYNKAGAVLLTLENYVGEETFRQGVHNYLAAHLYGNATAEDFWGAQTATSHKPVDKIMESFVTQPGVPMVAFGEPSGGKVTVSQRRFFLSQAIKPDPAQKWTMPVCFKPNGKEQTCGLLTPSSTSLAVPSGELLFPHAGGSGYFRASYPAAVYKGLLDHVETALTPSERIRLIGDEWVQVRSGQRAHRRFSQPGLRDQERSQCRGGRRRLQRNRSRLLAPGRNACRPRWTGRMDPCNVRAGTCQAGRPRCRRADQHHRPPLPLVLPCWQSREGPRDPLPGTHPGGEIPFRPILRRSDPGPDGHRDCRTQRGRGAV